MKLETQLAGGVVLVDVSKEMPRRRKAPYPEAPFIHRRRRLSAIERAYVHHSGSEGAPGLQGAINSARYVVQKKGFHCAAYHVWIPAKPLWFREKSGSLVICQARPPALYPYSVLRLNADSERTWHTGGEANTHGWNICLQGNLNKRDLTDFQKKCLEALLPWCLERFEGLQAGQWQPTADWAKGLVPKPDWLSWHSDPGHPGKYAEKWLREYLE